MHLDATAAKGIIEMRGLNKVRHIEADTLWLIEQKAGESYPVLKYEEQRTLRIL